MAELRVRELGLCPYLPVWERMKSFTSQRRPETGDELWLLEHEAVYTLGQAGKSEHVLDAGDIAVLPVDRGGQVTYHGPGQMVAYTMLDLRRHGIGVRALVSALEQSVIDWLAGHGISAYARSDAPGVYVDGAKLAALGLRVSRGCSYHGLSLNVDVALEPFARIDPCGFPGLAVTRTRDLGIPHGVKEISAAWSAHLGRILGYTLRRTPG